MKVNDQGQIACILKRIDRIEAGKRCGEGGDLFGGEGLPWRHLALAHAQEELAGGGVAGDERVGGFSGFQRGEIEAGDLGLGVVAGEAALLRRDPRVGLVTRAALAVVGDLARRLPLLWGDALGAGLPAGALARELAGDPATVA